MNDTLDGRGQIALRIYCAMLSCSTWERPTIEDAFRRADKFLETYNGNTGSPIRNDRERKSRE